MMLICTFASVEPLRPAEIRSLPAVAFRARPLRPAGLRRRRIERRSSTTSPPRLSLGSARPGRLSRMFTPSARYPCTHTDPWRLPALSSRQQFCSCSSSRGRRLRNRWTPRWGPKRGTRCSTGCSGYRWAAGTSPGCLSGDHGRRPRERPRRQDSPHRWYLTQPALMANLKSPSRRLVLRTTLNFEGVTLGNGELNYGGWGEGFIDSGIPTRSARGDAQLEPLGDRRTRVVAVREKGTSLPTAPTIPCPAPGSSIPRTIISRRSSSAGP